MNSARLLSKAKLLEEKLLNFKNTFTNSKNVLKNICFSKMKSKLLNPNLLKIPFILAASAFLLKSQHKKSLFQETQLKKVYLPNNQKNLEELKEGELAEFAFGSEAEKQKILILKKFGKLYAFNNECPYQCNPLHKGIVIHNKLKCPMHGDTFDLFTGENLIGPALDDLKKFELKFEEGNAANGNNIRKYFIEVEKYKNLKSKNKTYKKDPYDNSKFIIIGGGIAALSCAKTLRENGFKGEISIISEEKYLPYNRPAISKAFVTDVNKILLKDEGFYKDYDINVQLNTEVVSVNEMNKEVKLSNGVVKTYDKLLFCTGSTPKVPFIEGRNLPNVFTIKNFDDIAEIKQAAIKAEKIIIVGSSFSSIEVANLLKKLNKNLEIVVIDKNEAPFQKVLGKEIGDVLKSLHEKNGIKFKLEKKVNSISEFEKDKVKTKKIYLESCKKEEELENQNSFDRRNETNNNKKEFIYGDMVIFATGDSPNNSVLQKIVTIEDKKVKCDSNLKSSDSNIYCAGDVCTYPNIYTGQRVNFSYYVNAMMQGRVAALNMLGQNKTYDSLPYFWTMQGDKLLHFIGYFNKYDDIVITQPEPNNPFKFEAFYFRNGRLLGFCSMDSPNSANIVYEAIKNNIIITPDALRKHGLNVENISKQVANLEIYNFTLDQIKSTLDV